VRDRAVLAAVIKKQIVGLKTFKGKEKKRSWSSIPPAKYWPVGTQLGQEPRDVSATLTAATPRPHLTALTPTTSYGETKRSVMPQRL
jgi:hypothetical protein